MNSLPPSFNPHPDQEPFALSEADRLCLSCGLQEISQWKHQGPEAPALSPALLRQVSAKKPVAWSRYAYVMAAALALLFMFVQVAKQDLSPDPKDLQSGHILVDSALHDSVMLLDEDPNEDSIQTVSMKDESTHEQAGQAALQRLDPIPGLAASGLTARQIAMQRGRLTMTEWQGPKARTSFLGGVAEQPKTTRGLEDLLTA